MIDCIDHYKNCSENMYVNRLPPLPHSSHNNLFTIYKRVLVTIMEQYRFCKTGLLLRCRKWFSCTVSDIGWCLYNTAIVN